MSRKSMFTLFIGSLFFLTACAQYVEQATPPGQVAPPIQTGQVAPPIQMQSAKPYRNPHVPAVSPPQPAPALTNPAPAKPQPLMDSTIANDFDREYRRVGSPRLAIFLNRSLSDEVREWKTTERAVVSVSGEMTRTDGEKTESFKGPGGAAGYRQRHAAELRRQSPGEGWMWRFEEGFLGPFLDVGAKVIDRATIMRLTASASGRQGSAYDPIAVKKIEMDSLTGKADLFIEVLIRRNLGNDLGYEFKASAKEVKTGLIRANITSIGWDYGVEPTEKVIATGSGYKFVKDESSKKFPEMHIVSRDLALTLMRAMAENWQK